MLEEDEVFCSYADPYNMDQAGVVEGDCIITRAPARQCTCAVIFGSSRAPGD